MPTVLDSLVVELGLDPTQFTDGMRAALAALAQGRSEAERSGKEIETAGGRMENFLKRTKREALGLLALFFGGRGLKEFVGYITTVDASLGRSARTLGMNAGELSAWRNVAEQTGGTAEGMTAAMQGLTDEINTFSLTGDSRILPVLTQLGIHMQDDNGHFKTAGVLMKEINAAVQRFDPPRARAMMLALGLPGDVINTLLTSPAALRSLLDEQEKLNAVTEEDTRAAMELQKAWYQAEQGATTFGRKIMTLVTPALIALTSVVSRLFDRINNPGEGAALGQNIAELSAGEFYMPGSETGIGTPPGEGLPSLPPSRGQNLPSNWSNFLSGLSYLETSQTGAPSSDSTARGYFQFLQGTAAKARRAGLQDPRFGNWSQQADSTMKYIKKFYPEAAAAIDRGDYSAAAAVLRSEWPSLPGGSQQQNAKRYATWLEELQGGGPRPPIGAAAAASASAVTNNAGDVSHTRTTHIDTVNVHTQATDANGVADGLNGAIQRADSAAEFNYGMN